MYTEYDWLPWKFNSVPINSWEKNAKKFMDLAAIKLNVKTLDDWYKINKEDLQSVEGGTSLLRLYHNSLLQLLSSVYPEHGWLPWRFIQPNLLYWVFPNNWKQFLNSVAIKLNVKDMNDWYKITAEVVFCVEAYV